MKDASSGGQELLIIRRGGSAELDHPKGGVWKIAYADFMTAMMAFFLVMWLINATDDSTKTGIANYFNPIKLSDGRHLPKKGLRDPELTDPAPADPAVNGIPGPSQAADQQHPQGGAAAEHSRGRVARYTEEALFRDPYAVLAAIAAEAGSKAYSGLDAGGPGQAPGATGELDRIGSEPYRDPFDPPARTAAQRPASGESPASGSAPLAEQAPDPDSTEERPGGAAGMAGELAAIEPVQMTDVGVSGAGDAGSGNDAGTDDAPSGSPRLADRLLESLAEDAASTPMPNVSVTTGEDGVLISLSDQVDFGMFAIGSAEPLPETIAVMEKIAGLLKEVPGRVIIRGHTDGRPFRSDSYDNWRLSAARAHMAYHMLVRGGLDEARVLRIEGYADRDLKLPSDPEAAENRRIEILVREVRS